MEKSTLVPVANQVVARIGLAHPLAEQVDLVTGGADPCRHPVKRGQSPLRSLGDIGLHPRRFVSRLLLFILQSLA